MTVAVKPVVSWSPSRRSVRNPGSVKVRVYSPGRSSIIRKRPSLSVVAMRTFSMSAGLAASTVTPGSTAPDASLTTPVRVALLLSCDHPGNEEHDRHHCRYAQTSYGPPN